MSTQWHYARAESSNEVSIELAYESITSHTVWESKVVEANSVSNDPLMDCLYAPSTSPGYSASTHVRCCQWSQFPSCKYLDLTVWPGTVACRIDWGSMSSHHCWTDPQKTHQSIDDCPLFPFRLFQKSQNGHSYFVGVFSNPACVNITLMTIVIPHRMVLFHPSSSVNWRYSLPSSIARTKAPISIYFRKTLFWGVSGWNKTLRASLNCLVIWLLE